MATAASVPVCTITIEQPDEASTRLSLSGRLESGNAARVIEDVLSRLATHPPLRLDVNLERIHYFDDYGSLVLQEIRHFVESRKAAFQLINVPEHVESILSLVDFHHQDYLPTNSKKKPISIFVRMGEAVIIQLDTFKYMTSFLGSVSICLVHGVLHPRSIRWGDTIVYMQKTGVDAVPIVALISFLLGLIMAFVSSMQLEQFGAGIYVASLVALSMVSEFGPIITAIIVAGRSGSAYAAEIGTMQISEEIDALFTMGFQPTLFLAIPRLIAAVIVVPVLTLFSDVFAILGGLVVSSTMLDLTVGTYITQTLEALTLFELMWGLMKSAVFAVLIALVGCLRGFQVRGGASEVGNAATSAVVSSIFLIILFDSIFAVIRSYW
ncbi:MAG: MlaE family lipid ABC transporter permease subunit [Desulfobacteraceae bacterium]|nr:MlaE family lipid ABC transporter permease subunit [Desulfobacteraceae bacterium]